jgi:hypothetical protein
LQSASWTDFVKNSKTIEDLEISALMSPSALHKLILSHTIAVGSLRPSCGPTYESPIGFKCELAHLLSNSRIPDDFKM